MRICWLSWTLALAAWLPPGEAWGWSAGRWNMPSTPAQYWGYGYGPGHHAPMLRMPCCRPPCLPRLEFTSDCPVPLCSTCGIDGGGPVMHREMVSPVEAGPTPEPLPPMQSDHTRYVAPNLFLR
jgi:hypothetical protein